MIVDGSGLAGEAGDWEVVAAKLGFDFEWSPSFGAHTKLMPPFEEQVIAELPDGSRKVLNKDGAIVIQKEGATGIPSEVDHILKDRKGESSSHVADGTMAASNGYEVKVARPVSGDGRELLKLCERNYAYRVSQEHAEE